MNQFRKTLRRFEVPGHARFLTFSCFHRLALFNNDKIKWAFVEHLAKCREHTQFKLWAWVIMPEHVHLILLPKLPEFPIRRVLQAIKGEFSNRVLRRWRELHAPILPKVRDSMGGEHFWQQGGGYDRNIETFDEFEEKFDYIHKNPVTRGLAIQATDWPWSSARWYFGKHDDKILTPDSFDV